MSEFELIINKMKSIALSALATVALVNHAEAARRSNVLKMCHEYGYQVVYEVDLGKLISELGDDIMWALDPTWLFQSWEDIFIENWEMWHLGYIEGNEAMHS
jgi:hypothetical protein